MSRTQSVCARQRLRLEAPRRVYGSQVLVFHRHLCRDVIDSARGGRLTGHTPRRWPETGFWEIRARAAFDYSRLPPTGLLARNNFRLAVIRPQSPRRHGGPPLRLANCYEVGETRFP